MKHDTQKRGNPRYYVASLLWRNARDNLTLLPRDMQDYYQDRFTYTNKVLFYEYPDGFYGGREGTQLWKLNQNHRDWVMRVRAAMDGDCECPNVWDT